MSDITASVVLYRTPVPQIKGLFEALKNSTAVPETYFVDNSPAPSLLPFDIPSWAHYMHLNQNRGYGHGHNQVLKEVLTESKFHFVLNPDVRFGPSALETMIGCMQENPDVGQLMPKVVYPDGRLQYLCKLIPTPADLFGRRFGGAIFQSILKEKCERFELRHFGYDRVMDVGFLSGCFMLFRTSALQKVGIFDERFFMYAEDIDLSRRMHAQFRTIFFPGATIIHDHARSSYKNYRSMWIHMRSAIRYFNKWGWIVDPERRRFNNAVLSQFQADRPDPSCVLHQRED